MKRRCLALIAVAGIVILGYQPSVAATNTPALVRQAVSVDPAESARAIAGLRSLGPAGLQALYDAYGAEMSGPARPGDARRARLDRAVDEVGQQRDDWASRLYWYTDLEKAKAAARKTGKPILSLRLLGRLNDELSCANSRFFRTALYPNAEVSRYLREDFILHWQSERPAPRITIDFGDGRKIVRTITGNSIHYVLDSEGRPIDAIPGLYGPVAFLRTLRRDVDWTHKLAAAPDRSVVLAELHRDEATRLDTAWNTDAAKLRLTGQFVPPLWTLSAEITAGPAAPQRPSAQVAAPLAMTKGMAEIPVVRNVVGQQASDTAAGTPDPLWTALGALYTDDARLDANSRAVMAEKYPGDAGLDRLQAAFEASMARDTARNEYLFHLRIHEWFAQDASTDSLEALNRRVYAELFLTPRTDPWLGLSASNAYTALPNGGLVGATPTTPSPNPVVTRR
jgi:hypothetical protein